MADQESASGAGGKTPAPPAATVQIIWFALLASIGMYAVFGLVILKPGMMAQSMPPDQLNVVALALAGVSVMSAGFAFMAPRFLGKMPGFSLQILRWALAESIAVCGVLLRMLGGGTNWFLMFIAVSALLMLTLRPGQEEQKS